MGVCHLLVLALATLTLTEAVAATTTTTGTVRLKTRAAIYQGERLSVKIDDGGGKKIIDRFAGIRYGQPPKKSLRFRRPRPAWQLEGGEGSSPRMEIDATKFNDNCPQQPGFVEHLALHTKQTSEDCLHLNVWAPKFDDQHGKLRPVLVWLHGGSFISDSAARHLYDGQRLAALGDVVVVSVNYRLDTLGFLYSGPEKLNQTEAADGNLALWDQALALEWVQENIVYFNGDPERVTIAGHNAGATSVGLHLLSPQSRGRLFQRALLMSGSIFTQLVATTRKASTEIAQNWAQEVNKRLNCGDGQHWTIETLNCLRKASTDQLLKVLNPLGENPFAPEVVLGDDFLPFESLIEAVQLLSSSKQSINIMFGSTNDEGGLVLPMLSSTIFSLLTPKDLSQHEAYQELVKFASKLIPARGVRSKSIDGHEVARYYINQKSGGNYNRAIGEAIGDFYVTCPLAEFGRRLTRPSNNTSAIYQYLWSEKFAPHTEMPCADWMGACHGTDVAMLFGLPFAHEGDFARHDRQSSRNFIRAVSGFVHTG